MRMRVPAAFSPQQHATALPAGPKRDVLAQRWKLRIVVGLLLGYTLFNFTRQSLTCASPRLISDLGFSKTAFGALASMFSIVYGLSKFFCSCLSDAASPSAMLAGGLFMTGLLNVALALSPSLSWFALVWAMNGLFQGFGWPACAQLLRKWFSTRERGTWWSVASMSQNVGGAVIPFVVAAAMPWGWAPALALPGMLAIVGSGVVHLLVRDAPESVGLPAKVVDGPQSPPLRPAPSPQPGLPAAPLLRVLGNPRVLLLCAAELCACASKLAMVQWVPLFLVEVAKLSRVSAAACWALFDIGGMLGALLSGVISDTLAGGRRGPVVTAFSVSTAVAAVLFSCAASGDYDAVLVGVLPGGHEAVVSCAAFLLGFSYFASQALMGLFAMEMVHGKDAGVTTGVMNLFSLLGGALAGLPLGTLLDLIGWDMLFRVVATSMALCAGLSAVLWSARSVEEEDGAASAASSEVMKAKAE